MGNAITLQFSSLDELWAFRIEALIYFIEMNKELCTLSCKCSQADLALAVNKYRAKVVVGKKMQ